MSKTARVYEFVVSPLMRLLIYISLALLTTLLGEIQDITSEVAATYTWWDWLKILLVVIIPPLIVIRAFVDSSLSRNDNELFSLPEPVSKKIAPKKVSTKKPTKK
jgi:heme A synthase